MDLGGMLERLSKSSRLVALTGAGVSSESGIPTFREAQTGLWARYDPLELATPEAFVRNPKLVWDWYEWRRALCLEKKPNPGHYALATMARIFPHFVVITQNVDGLHRLAGSPDVVELHGNIGDNKCSREGTLVSRAEARPTADGLLACPRCGALVRPDVVWFDEPLPRAALDRAWHEAMSCDAFLAIGTSGVIEPAAALPRVARQAGALIVEINPQETPVSGLADFVWRGKSGELLPRLVKELENRSND